MAFQLTGNFVNGVRGSRCEEHNVTGRSFRHGLGNTTFLSSCDLFHKTEVGWDDPSRAQALFVSPGSSP